MSDVRGLRWKCGDGSAPGVAVPAVAGLRSTTITSRAAIAAAQTLGADVMFAFALIGPAYCCAYGLHTWEEFGSRERGCRQCGLREVSHV